MKKLFGSALGSLGRVSGAPQLKAAVDAVYIREALVHQIGRCALAGIAVVAHHQGRGIEVGFADELGDRMVIQMLGTGDVAGGKGLRVANVDDYRTLRAQGQGLFGRDALEFANGYGILQV